MEFKKKRFKSMLYRTSYPILLGGYLPTNLLLPSSELVGIKGLMHSISFNRRIVYVETLLRSDRVKKDKRS